jgi:hypothetical protein
MLSQARASSGRLIPNAVLFAADASPDVAAASVGGWQGVLSHVVSWQPFALDTGVADHAGFELPF